MSCIFDLDAQWRGHPARACSLELEDRTCCGTIHASLASAARALFAFGAAVEDRTRTWSGVRGRSPRHTMGLDEPSADQQLHSELRSAIQHGLRTRKPLLHRLNADTSWLLQIPRPEHAVKRGARFYYNILIDPWLKGGQTDVASWFSQQFHATDSAVQSVAELEDLIREVEILLASDPRLGPGRKTNLEVDDEHAVEDSFIDAVAVSHEFTVRMPRREDVYEACGSHVGACSCPARGRGVRAIRLCLLEKL